MVEIRNKALAQRQQDRMDRMRTIADGQVQPKVRVRLSKPHLKKLLRHPTTGANFTASETSEWPNDSFTKRRIRDGDIAIDKERSEEMKGKPQDQQPTTRRVSPRQPKTDPAVHD